MALDYDGASAGIFTRIGKIIKASNSYKSLATITFPADLKSIADPFEASDLTDQIEGLYSFYAEQQSAITSLRQSLNDYVQAVLTDRDTVLEQIAGLVESDISSVLPALARQMSLDSETINRSTVTIGTVTAGSSNIGNGTVLMTKVLDGFNSPLQGGQSYLGYNGLNSELAVTSETMTFTCTSDSGRDGVEEGTESFSWVGGIPAELLDWQDEGSGTGPSLTVMNAATTVSNGNFEEFTSNVPDSWTLDLGTAGTHVAQDTSAGNFYRGISALKLTGDGALATIRLSQDVAPNTLQARRMYCVSARIKASATIAAGTFRIWFAGTGYTAASTEKIEIAPGSLPTSWTLYHFFISMPVNLPEDWELRIEWSGTPTNAKSVWIDSLAFDAVSYHGGVGAVVVAGSTPFVVGDRFTVPISNNNAGIIQRYFREAFGFQLPSSTTPSIADSLAT